MLFQDSSFTPGDAGMHYVASSRFDIPGDDFGLVLGGGLLPNRLGIDGRTLGFEDLSKTTTGERFRPGDVRFARSVDGTGSPLGRLYRDPTDFQWKFSAEDKWRIRRNGFHRSGPTIKLDGVARNLWSPLLLVPGESPDSHEERRAIVVSTDSEFGGRMHVGDIVVAANGVVGEFFRVISRAGDQVQMLTIRRSEELPPNWPADEVGWLVTPWAPAVSAMTG